MNLLGLLLFALLCHGVHGCATLYTRKTYSNKVKEYYDRMYYLYKIKYGEEKRDRDLHWRKVPEYIDSWLNEHDLFHYAVRHSVTYYAGDSYIHKSGVPPELLVCWIVEEKFEVDLREFKDQAADNNFQWPGEKKGFQKFKSLFNNFESVCQMLIILVCIVVTALLVSDFILYLRCIHFDGETYNSLTIFPRSDY